MDINSLVKRMMRAAQSDCVNGVGRIIIPDFLNSLYDSQLQREHNLPSRDDMVTAWMVIHPDMPIHRRGKNVLIIELGRHGPTVQQPFEVKLEEGEELVRE